MAGYISPQSNGLLRGVISESGGCSAGDLSSRLAQTQTLGKAAGCNDTTPAALKACMQKLDDLTVCVCVCVRVFVFVMGVRCVCACACVCPCV